MSTDGADDEVAMTAEQVARAAGQAAELIDEIGGQVAGQLHRLRATREALADQLHHIDGLIAHLERLAEAAGIDDLPAEEQAAALEDAELDVRLLAALDTSGPAVSSKLRDTVGLSDDQARRLGPTVATLSRKGLIDRDDADGPWAITDAGCDELADRMG